MYTCTIYLRAVSVKRQIGRKERQETEARNADPMNKHDAYTQKNSRSRRVNRDAVARTAGVSSATVSRVYNHPETVAGETREAVLDAAEKLRYTPDKTASSLRRSGTGTITFAEFVKPDREYYWGALPAFQWFFADILAGVRSAVDDSMYTLQIVTLPSTEAAEELKGRTDGIIGYDIDRAEEAEALAALGIPYMLCHHTAHFTGCSRFSTSNYHGGVIQAEYLISQGSTNPGYITGYLNSVEPHQERLQGFVDTCRGQGLPYTIIDDCAGLEGGKKAAEQIAAGSGSGESSPLGEHSPFGERGHLREEHLYFCDGIAAVNDLTLLGFLYGSGETAARRLLDAAFPMIGYDAMPFQKLLPYRFASVDIDPKHLYQQAAQQLLSIIRKRDAKGLHEFSQTLPPKLMLPQQT